MSQFTLYFKLGMQHILDLQGYDHILFIVALCAVYLVRDWKKILILVTAFTIGHSITLAMATFNIIKVNGDLIEFLIPVTIFITAAFNIARAKSTGVSGNIQLNYGFAIIFGLIHGLGFSNYLKSLLGKNADIVQQLLAFNLGLELGQLLIVSIFLALSFVFIGIFGVNRRDWNMVISSAIAGISLVLLLEAKYW